MIPEIQYIKLFAEMMKSPSEFIPFIILLFLIFGIAGCAMFILADK